MLDRKRVNKAFWAYVNQYDPEDGKISLKIDHTFRVAQLSERIAESLHLSKEDVDLAWLIGMLHDVGRFEQAKVFHTFSDSISVNHALYGVKVLFEQGKIREYLEDDSWDSIIYEAILAHNLFRIPKGLDERTELFCKLIRDADKIDIMKVNVETPMETIYGIGPEEMKKLTLTDEVVEQFYGKTAVEHKYKKNHLDQYLMHTSLIFELEFPESYLITKEQGFVERIFAFRTEHEKTNHQIEKMEAFLETFIEEQLI